MTTKLTEEFYNSSAPSGIDLNIGNIPQMIDVVKTDQAFDVHFSISSKQDIPIEVAFTSQDIIDTAPESIEYSQVSKKSEGKFSVGKGDMKEYLLMVKTKNKDETSVVNVSIEVLAPTPTPAPSPQPTIATTSVIEETKKEKNILMYVVLGVVGVIFLVLMIMILSRKTKHTFEFN